jgi:Family of unknown function (DUF5906)/Primase C terminal 2 (PriCT-2)
MNSSKNIPTPEELQARFEKCFRGHRIHAKPEEGGTRTLTQKGVDGWTAPAAKWMSRQRKCNFYFSPARVIPGRKTTTKDDMLDSRVVWADLDPRPGQPLEQEREAILSLLTILLPDDVPTPTFLVDSGRGYWAYWLLPEPHVFDGANGDATRDFEAVLRGLGRAFGEFGDKSVKNINRITRLPGTLNLKTGGPAQVIAYNSGSYTLDQFPKAVIERAPPRRATDVEPLSSELIEQMLKATPYMGGPEGLDDRRSDDGWLTFMMAVHEACNGDPEGLSFFTEWSNGDDEYTGDGSASKIEARWNSLNAAAPGGVTRGSWIKLLGGLPGNEELLAKIDGDAKDDFPDDAAADNESAPAGVPDGSSPEWFDITKNWVHLGKLERFVDLVTRDMWKVSAFDNHFAYVKVMDKDKNSPLSKYIFRNRSLPMYKSVAYRPAGDAVINGNFNMWLRSDIAPVKGDTSWLDEHMAYLFPDEAARNRVLNWMAWVYQNQDKKPRHALLIHGEIAGTGKSALAHLLSRLLGRYLSSGTLSGTTTIKGGTLEAAHSGWEFQTKLVVVEEVRPGFGSSQAVVKGLHDLISEPTILVDKKNVDPETILNLLAFLLFSNKLNALTLDNSDRRYEIETVDPVPGSQALKPKSKAYYLSLYGKIGDPSNPIGDPVALAAVAYMLQNRDLGDYSGLSAAPLTGVKAVMAEETRDDLERWFDENIGQKPLRYSLVTFQEVLDVVPNDIQHKTTGLRGRLTSLMRSKLKGVSIGEVRFGGRDAPKHWLWSINGRVDPKDRSPGRDKKLAKLYRTEHDQLTPTEKAAQAEANARKLAEAVADFSDVVEEADAGPLSPEADDIEAMM